MLRHLVTLMILSVAISAASHGMTLTIGAASGARGETVDIPVSITVGATETVSSFGCELYYGLSTLGSSSFIMDSALWSQGYSSAPSNTHGGMILEVFASGQVMTSIQLGHIRITLHPLAPFGLHANTGNLVYVRDANGNPVGPNNLVPGSITVLNAPRTTVTGKRVLTQGGATIGAEVRLDKNPGLAIGSMSFSVAYDQAKLTYTSPTPAPSVAAAGKTLTVTPAGPGQLNVSVTGSPTTSLSGGPLVTLGFTVSATMTGGGESNITFSSLAASNPQIANIQNLHSDTISVMVPRVVVSTVSTELRAFPGMPLTIPIYYSNNGNTSETAALQIDIPLPYELVDSFQLPQDNNTGFLPPLSSTGPAAAAAGKHVQASYAWLQSGLGVRVIVSGVTAGLIQDGLLGTISVPINPPSQNTRLGVYQLPLEGLIAVRSDASVIPFAAAVGQTVTLGQHAPEDVDLSASVDVMDVQLTVNLIISTATPAYPGQGDVNLDQVVNVVDVQEIINRILNP